jgi:Family of unknown function (DUF6338)
VLTTPAIIFLYIRSRFTHGRMPKAGEAVLYFISITSVYFTALYPVIEWALKVPRLGPTWWLGWISLVFVIPALLGVWSGHWAHKHTIYTFLRSKGIDVVHEIPTAWEFKFSTIGPTWIVVTLKNGGSFGAEYGGRSFSSTSPDERDIYLEETYCIDEAGNWSKRGFGMWVAASEISTIEFSTRITEVAS